MFRQGIRLSKKQIFRKQKQTEKKSQSKKWVHAKEKGRGKQGIN